MSVERYEPALHSKEVTTVITASGEFPYTVAMVDLEDGNWVRYEDFARETARADAAEKRVQRLEAASERERSRSRNYLLSINSLGEAYVKSLTELNIGLSQIDPTFAPTFVSSVGRICSHCEMPLDFDGWLKCPRCAAALQPTKQQTEGN